ncbi:MAG: TIM barrel protein [Candidatus Pacearchaeota archaeon]
MPNKEIFYPGLFRPPESVPETEPSDLFVGYRLPASKLGAGASAFSINQIQEVSNRLNTGMKIVEAGVISHETFQKIPKQHFQEIARLAKLTGSEVTWHAPIVDPAGFTGDRVDEETRKTNEAILWDCIEKATIATGGRQPITIHSTSGIPASAITRVENGKEVVEAVGVIDIVNDYRIRGITGKPLLKPEEIAEGKIPEPLKPEQIDKFLEEKNKERWNEFVDFLERKKMEVEPSIIKYPIEQAETMLKRLEESYAYRLFQKPLDALTQEERASVSEMMEREGSVRELKYGLLRSRNLFSELKDDVDRIFRVAWEACEYDKRKQEKLREIAKKIKEVKPDAEGMMALTNIFNQLKEISPPMFIKAEDFARQKASETIANLAAKAYEKFKDKAPILSIENLFPNQAFGRSEELKKLIEESRQKFVEKMAAKVGEKRAKELAEQMIGATWDIGHANIWRSYGKKPEEIKAELEKIKPFVKHVHITDNFGFVDSHLPPGMGNIQPEVFKELKSLLEKGVKGVLEVPTLALPPPQGFGVSPYPYALAALGSPLYTYAMAPFWNQALSADLPAYFTGYGPILPEQHFTMYGAGFSALPIELGGQVARKTGFGGAPME